MSHALVVISLMRLERFLDV